MSGMYYNNPYANPYAAQNLQYGVNMPAPSSGGAEALGTASTLASFIPYVGPLVSAGLNFAGQAYQNYKQEQFYNDYMSPQARMAQMKAAGINPNAAAEGISGAAAPSMVAAAPSSAGNGVGEQLGNSVNTALTADAIRSQSEKNYAEAGLANSLNTEKQTTNRYLDAMQQATLNKLVQDGRISKSFANMVAVDEAYKPAMAEQSYNLLLNQVEQVRVGIEKLNAEIVHEYAAAYQSMMAGSLSEAEIHKVFSDIGVNNAMITKIAHEVGEIDARTAATYQGITESQARTSLLNIQKGFESRYLQIFKSTGYDVKQGINSNYMSLLAQGKVDNANVLLGNLQCYLQAEGDGRANGKDYKFTVINDYLRTYSNFVGLGALSSSLRQNAYDKGVQSGYNSGFDYARSIYGD